MILIHNLRSTIGGNLVILARDVSGYDTNSIPGGIIVRSPFRDIQFRFTERIHDKFGFIDRFLSDEAPYEERLLLIEHDTE
jgi:hypothetical protein